MRRQYLYAAAFFTLFALLATYPMAFRLSDHFVPVASYRGKDYAQFLWDFWWVKKALVELFVWPYHTDYLYYPDGVDLTFHTLTLYNSVLSIPLQYVFDLVTTYNLLYLSTLVLSGLGAYALTLYLTGSRAAGLVSGLVFGFNAGHVGDIGQINVASIQWIPFFALALTRLNREKKLSYALWAALFLFLGSLCEWNQAVFLFYLLVVFSAFVAVSERGGGRAYWTGVVVMGLVYLAAISPFAYPLVKETLAGSFSYLVPPPSNRPTELFGAVINTGTGRIFFNWGLGTGYAALALALVTLSRPFDKNVVLWWAVTFFFFLLLLGPHPAINGVVYESVPLPKALFDRIPVLNGVRLPVRFFPMFMLGISVLAGYGTASMLKKPAGRLKHVLAAAILCILALEYVAIPRPCWEDRVPEYYKILSREPGGFAVVSIPLYGMPEGLNMYRQTVHGKKMPNGYISRNVPEEAVSFAQSNGFLRSMQAENFSRPWGQSPPFGKADLDSLSEKGIRYVMVPKGLLVAGDRPVLPPQPTKDRFLPPAFNNTYRRLHRFDPGVSYFSDPERFDAFVDGLELALGRPCYTDGDLVVFELPVFSRK